MKTLKIIIEYGEDMFGAYAERISGVYGSGDTVEETKQSILDSIKLLKEYNTAENIPSILKGEYNIVYHFNVG